MCKDAQIFASARNFLDSLNFRVDPAPSSSKADERGVTKLDWLESRHTFSFGEYFDLGGAPRSRADRNRVKDRNVPLVEQPQSARKISERTVVRRSYR